MIAQSKSGRLILLHAGIGLLAAFHGVTAANAKGSVTKWSKSTGVVGGVTISLFSAPVDNTGIFRIATGSDGNLWFGESNPSENPNPVVKFTTKGSATAYAQAAGVRPEGLALGADGNIWFAEFTSQYIDVITPKGAIKKRIPLGTNALESCALALGAGKVMYVATDTEGVWAIPPKGAPAQINTTDDGAQPVGLGLGPDKNMWFIDVSGPIIGKITPDGQVTPYQSGIGGGANWGIVGGPDGRVWYTNESAAQVVAINVDGTGKTGYTVAHKDGSTASPTMIVAGPDGNLYVGEADGYIDKVTPAGSVTAYELPGSPGANFAINGMTVGPDGNIWFANDGGAQVGVFVLKK